MSEKYKVLLIEDEKIDQMAFKRFVELESLPYDYVIAESIAETKKLINSNNYNIIIADYSLADGTALEIFDLQIDSPIIIVTGSGDEEIAVKAMKLG
ncbi:MAG: response regulator, partial [Spirochaetota bacterium]|nr:response regulator [Spirochaetota bacterium]